MPLYDAIYSFDGIRHILDAMSKAVFTKQKAMQPGKIGVAVVTSGPGATNAITGIVDAMSDVPFSLYCQVAKAGIGKDAL